MNNSIARENQLRGETNSLYIRMRNRFDFSGNRTIGEFMAMKATREGYTAPAKAATPRHRASGSRKALVSIASLLLSCIVLIFCAVGVVDAVMPNDTPTLGEGYDTVMIRENSDPAAMSLIFPQNDFTSTIEE
jgi:hypothetical protein